MRPIDPEKSIESKHQPNRPQSVSHAMPELFRAFNRLNPTSHGRHYVSELAMRLGLIPEDGEFQVAPGVTMELHMKDYIERSIYFDSFEFICRRIVMGFLKPGSIFVDIGANVGFYSLLANERVGAEGRVLSFEPNPVTARKLKTNIALSGAKQIELFEMALSDKGGEVRIYCPKDETHGFTSMRNQGWQDADSYLVPARRLDDVIPKNLSHIDLVKIDVEGAELLVFQGGADTIRKFKPPILLELNEKAAESFSYDTLDIVKLLLSFNPNYRMKFIDAHSVVPITMEELFSKSVRNGNLILY